MSETKPADLPAETPVESKLDDLKLEDSKAESIPEAESEEDKKKKKKSKNKKKKKLTAIDNSYPDGIFPEGEWQEYLLEVNSYRVTSEEKRYLDRQRNNDWQDFRKGAEIHRRVRQKAKSSIKPGMSMIEIADLIENSIRTYTGNDHTLKQGIGFPTGLSLNHVAAHFTPNTGDKTVLSYEDVMKVDIGVHVNGHIVDSAFTLTFDDKYDNLLNAVKEATNTGVKEAGIDVRLNDIGEAVQEVMESYEVELNEDAQKVGEIWSSLEAKYKEQLVSKKLRVNYVITDSDEDHVANGAAGVGAGAAGASAAAASTGLTAPSVPAGSSSISTPERPSDKSINDAYTTPSRDQSNGSGQAQSGDDLQKELDASNAEINNLSQKLDSNEKVDSSKVTSGEKSSSQAATSEEPVSGISIPFAIILVILAFILIDQGENLTANLSAPTIGIKASITSKNRD
ncbi:hypothetical protein QCA50_018333 [Cerrena zonata]|uniref:Peptidase M24 domain-containing protein n=1 Tax=Cerrena zonata TaxID=2478898 RepID=A0AAW0FPI6_9APHY